MNRLVIVGNGFDLAHGLPTSYSDFINWYWKDIISKIEIKESFDYQDECINIRLSFYSFKYRHTGIKEQFRQIDSYKTLKSFISSGKSEINEIITFSDQRRPEPHDTHSLKIKNNFLKLINEKHQIQNWVDIENEYYRLLKECLKEEDNSKVKKLNKEFEQVKNLLEVYLNEVSTIYSLGKVNSLDLLRLFTVNQAKLNPDSKYLDEFPKEFRQKLIEDSIEISKLSQLELRHKIWDRSISEENLFVNFNYTVSMDKYVDYMWENNSFSSFGASEQIQIHGRLNNPENKINFGFGDEMDNHYKQIEEKDDKEYLTFIKSFQYFQNSNYKKVLDYIDSDVFQVYIMGHSCGLSDRILLNTIFEHTNCISIKVFYHQKEDGTNNYTEIVQNISRHVNKKKMMRDKIVNKSLCVPLPQNIRFEKI